MPSFEHSHHQQPKTQTSEATQATFDEVIANFDAFAPISVERPSFASNKAKEILGQLPGVYRRFRASDEAAAKDGVVHLYKVSEHAGGGRSARETTLIAEDQLTGIVSGLNNRIFRYMSVRRRGDNYELGLQPDTSTTRDLLARRANGRPLHPETVVHLAADERGPLIDGVPVDEVLASQTDSSGEIPILERMEAVVSIGSVLVASQDANRQ